VREHRDARTTAEQCPARCGPRRLRDAVGPGAISLKSRQKFDTEIRWRTATSARRTRTPLAAYPNRAATLSGAATPTPDGLRHQLRRPWGMGGPKSTWRCGCVGGSRKISRRRPRLCLSAGSGAAAAGGLVEAVGRLMGAGVVGAVGVGAPPVAICSASPRAKSPQRAKRSAGSLASATASTGSGAASSDRVSDKAGGGVLRWRPMTTAGLECGNRAAPVSRWYALSDDAMTEGADPSLGGCWSPSRRGADSRVSTHGRRRWARYRMVRSARVVHLIAEPHPV